MAATRYSIKIQEFEQFFDLGPFNAQKAKFVFFKTISKGFPLVRLIHVES